MARRANPTPLAQLIARYGYNIRVKNEGARIDLLDAFFAELTVPVDTRIGVDGLDPERDVVQMQTNFQLLPDGMASYAWLYCTQYQKVDEQLMGDFEELAPPGRRQVRLPDSAPVIRGGTMQISDLQKTCRTANLRSGLRGFSVTALHTAVTADDLLAEHSPPHLKYCETTAGNLRDNGLEIRRTFPRREAHYTVMVPDDSTDTLEQVRKVFSAPQAKPTGVS